jgi:hypothetical protein
MKKQGGTDLGTRQQVHDLFRAMVTKLFPRNPEISQEILLKSSKNEFH